ncbi:MAG: hypothetical protein WC676_01450 [Candidatus Omnitrophota bacterium]
MIFQFLNRLLHPLRPIKPKHARLGQVALILILITAVLIIFLAVVMNLGRVAQTKAQVTIAANLGAAFLASEIASYSQYLYQYVLDGGADLHVCGTDHNFLRNLTTLVIAAIILIAVIIFTAGAATPAAIQAATVLTISAGAGLAGATINFVLSVAVLQPGLSEFYNKMFPKMTQQDQFLERGILMGIQNVVDDNKEMPDNLDEDMDGVCDRCGTDDSVGDKTNRFGYYYANRVREIQENSDVVEERLENIEKIAQFQDLLSKLIYESYTDRSGTVHDDDWGMWDPFTPTCTDGNTHQQSAGEHACCNVTDPNRPAECNCCCLPEETVTIPVGGGWWRRGVTQEIRPECCTEDEAELRCNATEDPSSSCPATSWPYVYDPIYENGNNAFKSFREILGHDDENPLLKTSPPGNYNNPQISDVMGKYRAEDATGLFPALWKVADRTYLQNNTSHNPDHPEGCFWCDARYPGCDSFDAVGRLSLTGNCSGESCCLTTTNQDDDAYFDNIHNATCVIAQEDRCVTNADLGPAPCTGSRPKWKRGDDQFCSETWPYNQNCVGKHCPGDCPSCLDPSADLDHDDNPDHCAANQSCEDAFSASPGTPASEWPEDSLDQMKITTDDFIVWATKTLAMPPEDIYSSFNDWYNEAKTWIDNSNGNALYDLAKASGPLNMWRAKLSGWRNGNSQYHGYWDSEGMRSVFCPNNVTWINNNIAPYPGVPIIPQVLSCYQNPAGNGTIEMLQACYNSCNASGDVTPCHLFNTHFINNTLGYDTVNGIWPQCADPGFLEHIALLREKYQQRYNFLSDAYTKAGDAATKLADARTKISEFLTTANLPNGISSVEDSLLGDIPSLPPYAIYGWKTDKGCGRNPDGSEKGCWHIVRVEAKIPTRCDGGCGRPGLPEPDWPRVKNSVHGTFNQHRCNSVGDVYDKVSWCNEQDEYHHTGCFKGGKVKVRVTRWDQDKDLSFRFANAMPIWGMSFSHPQKGPASVGNINSLSGCLDTPTEGAFMVKDDDCRARAESLLSHGVMSLSCAEYFWHNGNPWGFNVKFSDQCQW